MLILLEYNSSHINKHNSGITPVSYEVDLVEILERYYRQFTYRLPEDLIDLENK